MLMLKKSLSKNEASLKLKKYWARIHLQLEKVYEKLIER